MNGTYTILMSTTFKLEVKGVCVTSKITLDNASRMSLIPAYKSSSFQVPCGCFDDLTTCFFLSAVRLLGFLSRESGLE